MQTPAPAAPIASASSPASTPARAITPATALRLETPLGEHAKAWMARPVRHDREVVRRVAAS